MWRRIAGYSTWNRKWAQLPLISNNRISRIFTWRLYGLKRVDAILLTITSIDSRINSVHCWSWHYSDWEETHELVSIRNTSKHLNQTLHIKSFKNCTASAYLNLKCNKHWKWHFSSDFRISNWPQRRVPCEKVTSEFIAIRTNVEKKLYNSYTYHCRSDILDHTKEFSVRHPSFVQKVPREVNVSRREKMAQLPVRLASILARNVPKTAAQVNGKIA